MASRDLLEENKQLRSKYHAATGHILWGMYQLRGMADHIQEDMSVYDTYNLEQLQAETRFLNVRLKSIRSLLERLDPTSVETLHNELIQPSVEEISSSADTALKIFQDAINAFKLQISNK